MKKTLITLFSVFSFALLSQDKKLGTNEGVCSIDAEKFCGGIQAGGEQAKCLLDHVHELSPDCKNRQIAPKEVFSKAKKPGKKAKSTRSN